MSLRDPDRVTAVLCDLDGVVWLDHRPIDGAPEAIGALRDSGRRVLFVTNNSLARIADHERALESIGIAAVGDVISSAMAAGYLVESGERVLVCGGPGIVEAVQSRDAVAIVNTGEIDEIDKIDVVIVGLHREFDYARLTVATAAIHAGARLIGTNSDPTYPTPRGLEPGGGSLLAAVAVASGIEPTIAGKPHAAMAALIIDVIGGSRDDFDPTTILMVGDRPDTDGLMAAAIGCPFVLVRTGVTTSGEAVRHVEVALDVADLASLAVHLGVL